jgi:hypothetical protein
MPVASITGLVIVSAALCLCGLFSLLYVWRQRRSRRALQYQHHPSLLTDKLYSPVSSASPRHVAERAAPRTSRCQWRTQTAAADQSAAPSTVFAGQSADAVSAVPPARLRSSTQAAAGLEPPIHTTRPFRLKRGSARRFVANPERAWPQPLLLAQTFQDSLVEQRMWRSSSGGSSCYSRPSSWYSVGSRDGLGEADTYRELEAGSGPTLQADKVMMHRHKALLPLPTQEEQYSVFKKQATNMI